MTITQNAFIMSDTHITIYFDDGFQTTVYNNNSNYSTICDAVRSTDWVSARQLADPVDTIKKAITYSGEGQVKIEDGVVFFGDQELHTTLTDRMLTMISDGFDITPLTLFLENLMQNPSYRAVNELYDFLEASNLPITDDGYFLAYKCIKNNYTDCHTGKIDNSIGAIVEMPRNQVDEDKHQTCSSGLHFCARSYIPHFKQANGRVVVLKINPADVVAIPTDYNNAKGRTCRYEVVQELKDTIPEIEGAVDTNYTANILQIDRDNNQIVSRYKNIAEAADSTGIQQSYIARVLRGEREITGGYRWQYELRDTNPHHTDDEYDDEYDESW